MRNPLKAIMATHQLPHPPISILPPPVTKIDAFNAHNVMFIALHRMLPGVPKIGTLENKIKSPAPANIHSFFHLIDD